MTTILPCFNNIRVVIQRLTQSAAIILTLNIWPKPSLPSPGPQSGVRVCRTDQHDRRRLPRFVQDIYTNTPSLTVWINSRATRLAGRQNSHNEKALRETQTLRAGCSKAEPKKFRPAADTLPGSAGWPKFNQLKTLETQFGEDRCTQFQVIVVTDPHTDKQTHRQDRLQYTAPLSLARSVINRVYVRLHQTEEPRALPTFTYTPLLI